MKYAVTWNRNANENTKRLSSRMTYTKMLQDIRIHESCSLLLDTSWSVQTIALEVVTRDDNKF